jgi:hypothetical protein
MTIKVSVDWMHQPASEVEAFGILLPKSVPRVEVSVDIAPHLVTEYRLQTSDEELPWQTRSDDLPMTHLAVPGIAGSYYGVEWRWCA